MADRTKEQIERSIENIIAGDKPVRKEIDVNQNFVRGEATPPAVETHIQNQSKPKYSAIELNENETAFLCAWPDGMRYVLQCLERYIDPRTGRSAVLPEVAVQFAPMQWKVFDTVKDKDIIDGLRKQNDYNMGVLMEAGNHLPKRIETEKK